MRAPAQHLRITQASRRDLPALGRVWLELMHLHADADPHFALADDALARWMAMAEEMIGRDDAFLIKAELDRRLVGLCLGWIAQNPPIYEVKEVGFISEIAVVRSVRRRGIGRGLLREARRWFRDHGLDELQLSTAVWNQTARSFWESQGGTPLLVRYRFDTED